MIQENTLIDADCLEVMDRISDKSVDFILCDLPYGIARYPEDKVIPMLRLWEQYDRVIKDNGAIALFGVNPFLAKLIHSSPVPYRYSWYWEKDRSTGHLNAYKMPMKNVEEIAIFYKKQPIYNYQLTDKPIKNIRSERKSPRKNSCYGSAKKVTPKKIPLNKSLPNQILSFNKQKNNNHPNEKPVSLLEYLVKTYSNEQEIILDNACGSGSTAIACLNTNRKYICIEKAKKYYDVAKDRINRHKKHLFLC